MFATTIITFREFFEAFLIVGMFLGISKKFHLKKEKEIIIASCVGVGLSIILVSSAFLLDRQISYLLTEKNADMFESYLLIFSALFIGYIVLSLHKTLGKHRKKMIENAHQKLEKEIFDFSLFLTIVFLILREGFEIALFTAGTSLFSSYLQNMFGLLTGFLFSLSIGTLVYFAYAKLSVRNVFKITEYLIVFIGASMMQIGITKFFQTSFSIYLSGMLPIHLTFLPGEDSFVGNFFQSMLGVDQNLSLARVFLSFIYIEVMYVFYMRQHKDEKDQVTNLTNVANVGVQTVETR